MMVVSPECCMASLRQRSYHNLVQKVLDELLLEWSRRQKAVQIGTEKLCDKVTSWNRSVPELPASSFGSMSFRTDLREGR